MQHAVNPVPSHTPLARRKVVGLIRVSTAEQAGDDRGGIPRQRRVIEDTIAKKNLDCLRVYEVVNVSGTCVQSCPEIIELLSLVKARIVEGVVLADLDRLFRPDQPTDFALLQVFKDTGCVIYSGDIEYDLTSKEGFLMSGIRSAISGFERMLIIERMQGSKEAKRKMGLCPSAYHTLPLGLSYDRRTNKFFYNEKIALVQELFRLIDEEGISNRRELQRRTGIQHRTLTNLVANEAYLGWRVYLQKAGERPPSTNGTLKGRKMIPRTEDEIIRVKVIDESAVSPERFERVQRIMAEVRFNHIERRKACEMVRLATGISRCGFCGELIFCTSEKKTRRGERIPGYYYCKNNNYEEKARTGGCKQGWLRRDLLEETLEAFTKQKLADPEVLTEIINGSLRKSQETIISLPGVGADPSEQIKKLKQRDKRLVAAYEEEAIDLAEFKERRRQIRIEIAALENARTQDAGRTDREIEEFARLVVRGASRFATLQDRKTKKEVILGLFAEVIWKDYSLVAFRFAPDLGLTIPGAELPIYLPEPFRIPQPGDEIPHGHKKCTGCHQILPLMDGFHKRTKDATVENRAHFFAKCRKCESIDNAARYQRRVKRLRANQA